MIRAFLLAIMLVGCAVAQDSSAARTIKFQFDRAGLPVSSYTFTLHPDGSGTYVAAYPATATGYTQVVPAAPVAGPVTRPLMVTPAKAAKLFEHAVATARFHTPCASKAKNIADSGAKTLTYTGPEGGGECSFNYTENKHVIALAEAFQGMAYTLDIGHELEARERFDRLGLDAEMGLLVDSLGDGRALGLENIAPILQALVDDTQVLERVRMRAKRLLEISLVAR